MSRLVELKVLSAETHTSLFELYHSHFNQTGKKARRMNRGGNKAITYWDFVGEYMRKEKQDNTQSYINCLYNVGRISSKLRAKTNFEMKTNLLKTLDMYKQVETTIKKIQKENKTIDKELEEQLKCVQEFVHLLPMRIAQIKC